MIQEYIHVVVKNLGLCRVAHCSVYDINIALQKLNTYVSVASVVYHTSTRFPVPTCHI